MDVLTLSPGRARPASPRAAARAGPCGARLEADQWCRRCGCEGTPRGEGRSADLGGGFGVDFKLMGADTGGQLAVVEHPSAVGPWVPPHSHSREDEFSIVVEGEIGFRSEDDEVVLGPGGYLVKPRDQVHAMWNAGPVPARMIDVFSPCGFENFFADLADLVGSGASTDERALELAGRYGLPPGCGSADRRAPRRLRSDRRTGRFPVWPRGRRLRLAAPTLPRRQ